MPALTHKFIIKKCNLKNALVCFSISFIMKKDKLIKEICKVKYILVIMINKYKLIISVKKF